MSKTDKTKPWRVRVVEHASKAEHHHPDGICDLPANPLEQSGPWSQYYCHWSHAQWWGFGGGCCTGCGCWMCTGHVWRREERRRNRHQAQRAGNALLKTARSDDTGIGRPDE